ncbi:MAG: LCP family protein [Bacillota bacterium]|nr:LCP family protein [Bacillota bacterium]
MNSRKFYFTVSIIISIFLFITGILALSYISATKSDDSNKGDLLSDLMSPFVSDKDPVNILVLGGDKVNHNTDTMMLVNFNPSTGKINILSIPRDSKVNVKGSSLPKINSAYPVGGADLAISTVSNFLNVNIQHYVFIDTSAFRDIIDELGGVEYYVPVDMDRDDPVQNLHIHLKEGQQLLDGAKAEQFMRFREYNTSKVNKYYDGSDIKRIAAQQSFISELIRQKCTIGNIPKLKNVLRIVFNDLETDMKFDDVMRLSQNLGKVSSDNVSMFTLPGKDANLSNGWYYVIDMNGAQKIIDENFQAKGIYTPDNTNNKNNSGSYSKSNSQSNKTKQTPKTTPKTNTKKPLTNVTKDNPSNSETNMTGTNNPQG